MILGECSLFAHSLCLPSHAAKTVSSCKTGTVEAAPACVLRKKKDHTAVVLRSVRQGLSAFRSATGQHLATVAVGHSFTEAMLLLAVQLLRLIGTKHSKYTSLSDSRATFHFQRPGSNKTWFANLQL